MACARAGGSATPASSRAECMESSGMPTSTVCTPSRVAVSGPMVEPHGTVLWDTNSWVATPARRQARRHSAAPWAPGRSAEFGVDLEQRTAVEHGRFAGSCRSG